MSRRVSAGPAANLAAGKSLVIETPAEPVAVFNMDGAFYACSSRCPHAGGPLADGFTRGTSVVCPWHGWNFDLSVPTDEALDGVIRYSVLIESGELFVELS
jgi:nitrite reductase/ring-hydroxylating ferredoxin subunit